MKTRRILLIGILAVAAVALIYYFFLRPAEVQANGMSYGAVISADGRYVAFHSEADNLVPGDANQAADVFLSDTVSGELVLVSKSAAGEQGDAGSYNASLDASGKLVVFISEASNLVPGDDNTCEDNGRRHNCPDVFLRDTGTGAVVRVSTDTAGRQANWKSEAAAIAADGEAVAFSSYASNLVSGDDAVCDDPGGARNCSEIFIKDLASGKTELVSATADGEAGDGDSFGPSLSADGRYVVFHSRASNLVPRDTDGDVDVFIKDTRDGSIVRVSAIDGGIGGNADSYNGVVSADGRRVAFVSAADNLVAGDANDAEDIFVKDLDTGAIELVSRSVTGSAANGNSARPAIAGDGSRVAFDTVASSLYGGDTAKCGEGDRAASCADVLVKGLADGMVILVSADGDGAQGNWNSFAPALSADGSRVAFSSEASNLAGGDSDACSDGSSSWNCSDIFLKDIASGATLKISSTAPE